MSKDHPLPTLKAADKVRFWSKVNVSQAEDCWEWAGERTTYGGLFWLHGKRWSAARVAYTVDKEPIPAGFLIDRACGNCFCVNPAHLLAVSPEDHVRLRGSPYGVNFRKDSCDNGHEFTPNNTAWNLQSDGRWRRTCRDCRNQATREYLQRSPSPVRRIEKCKHGHEFTPENTRVSPDGVKRACKECGRRYSREYRARRRGVS